jgi:predicted patatin/cPLA2 family phospholipase
VLESPTRLHVVVSDAMSARAVIIDVWRSSVPLLTILKASSAMPLLHNQHVEVEGRGCFDGGFLNPLPILEAIEDGCTDILVLMTRPAKHRELPPGWFEIDLFRRRCAQGNDALTEAFRRCYSNANHLRDIALGRSTNLNVNIATICPEPDEPTIEWTERSSRILKTAAIASARRVLETFGHPCEEFVEVVRPFPYSSPWPSPGTPDGKIAA